MQAVVTARFSPLKEQLVLEGNIATNMVGVEADAVAVAGFLIMAKFACWF
nr:hypothetical protein [Acetobacter pasteurianus]